MITKLIKRNKLKYAYRRIVRLAHNNIGGTVRTMLRFLFTDHLLKKLFTNDKKRKFFVLATIP